MSLSWPTCEPSQTTIFGLLNPSISSPAASHASPGASPASKAGPTTSATSGPTSSPSGYASAQRRFSSRMSLGSRAILEALTGSRVTLSGRATPGGRAVCVLRTSARPTSGTGCSSAPSGWGTPKESDHRPGLDSRAFETARINLNDQSLLAPWPTATAQDAVSSGRAGRAPNSHPGTTLTDAAEMVPWLAPQTTDAGAARSPRLKAGEADRDSRDPNQSGSWRADLKDQVAEVTPWPAPQSRDHKGDGREAGLLDHNSRPLNELVREVVPWATPNAVDAKGPNPLDRRPPCDDDLPTQILRVTPGLTPAPSSAATEKPASYRLNWRFSHWLMGLPAGLLDSAHWETRSSRSRPTSPRVRSSRSS